MTVPTSELSAVLAQWLNDHAQLAGGVGDRLAPEPAQVYPYAIVYPLDQEPKRSMLVRSGLAEVDWQITVVAETPRSLGAAVDRISKLIVTRWKEIPAAVFEGDTVKIISANRRTGGGRARIPTDPEIRAVAVDFITSVTLV